MQTNKTTSGQNVPKSKFRQKSQQEQTAASKLRMERRSEKLDKARETLAKQKPPKKPGPVKKVGWAAGGAVHGYVHGKIYEVEHENVGTEGAHRSELVGEAVYRYGSRKIRKAIREHPAKSVQRAESKHIKAAADYHYRQMVAEHPEMQNGSAMSRYFQKQRIRHQYANQARKAAKQTVKAAGESTVATEKLAARTVVYSATAFTSIDVWSLSYDLYAQVPDLYYELGGQELGPMPNSGLVFIDGFDISSNWGNMYPGSRFALYVDANRKVYVIDLGTGENSIIEGYTWPDKDYPDIECVASPDGNKLLIKEHGSNGQHESIGVLDFENKCFIQFSHENLNVVGEMLYWFDNDHIIIHAAGEAISDYYVYELLSKS